MNRINKLFQQKQGNILSVYCTAGYPLLDSTAFIIKALAKAGADMIEIGIPFSDPMADGPVIQKSSDRALKNGMTLNLLFEQLIDLRKEVTIPLIMMGYLNPVMQFGMENFCLRCSEAGIDGVILPDLPLDLYLEEYKSVFAKYHLKFVFLISPQTAENRIRLIDKVSNGFIYMVSASSTTGVRKGFSTAQIDYFERIDNMKLRNPRLIGFGISSHDTFSVACRYAQGAIIGSAFVKALHGVGDPEEKIRKFCHRILKK
ncbi:MAG: tryptophan synthase subunit alpha [Bacteroidales bacterium]|nr:tryptophan synthase subunit alpha [Bacteroidales bacterium]MBN2762338.1 tryptophan synthase subunit alpha [Bacteroidales bacterium]